jgi:hypothetical protein
VDNQEAIRAFLESAAKSLRKRREANHQPNEDGSEEFEGTAALRLPFLRINFSTSGTLPGADGLNVDKNLKTILENHNALNMDQIPASVSKIFCPNVVITNITKDTLKMAKKAVARNLRERIDRSDVQSELSIVLIEDKDGEDGGEQGGEVEISRMIPNDGDLLSMNQADCINTSGSSSSQPAENICHRPNLSKISELDVEEKDDTLIEDSEPLQKQDKDSETEKDDSDLEPLELEESTESSSDEMADEVNTDNTSRAEIEEKETKDEEEPIDSAMEDNDRSKEVSETSDIEKDKTLTDDNQSEKVNHTPKNRVLPSHSNDKQPLLDGSEGFKKVIQSPKRRKVANREKSARSAAARKPPPEISVDSETETSIVENSKQSKDVNPNETVLPSPRSKEPRKSQAEKEDLATPDSPSSHTSKSQSDASSTNLTKENATSSRTRKSSRQQSLTAASAERCPISRPLNIPRLSSVLNSSTNVRRSSRVPKETEKMKSLKEISLKRQEENNDLDSSVASSTLSKVSTSTKVHPLAKKFNVLRAVSTPNRNETFLRSADVTLEQSHEISAIPNVSPPSVTRKRKRLEERNPATDNDESNVSFRYTINFQNPVALRRYIS